MICLQFSIKFKTFLKFTQILSLTSFFASKILTVLLFLSPIYLLIGFFLLAPSNSKQCRIIYHDFASNSECQSLHQSTPLLSPLFSAKPLCSPLHLIFKKVSLEVQHSQLLDASSLLCQSITLKPKLYGIRALLFDQSSSWFASFFCWQFV